MYIMYVYVQWLSVRVFLIYDTHMGICDLVWFCTHMHRYLHTYIHAHIYTHTTRHDAGDDQLRQQVRCGAPVYIRILSPEQHAHQMQKHNVRDTVCYARRDALHTDTALLYIAGTVEMAAIK
jgi:hypothetical protein